ncbi:MAG: type II secretion system protein [Eggerthellaceae bacterium]|nr:type II secretion system protein [Eggerthellaceae bacterium]
MKARRQAGFTFVETLMALLIFVLLTAVVAAGIPTAYRTYIGVVNSSNAQLALSATTSALRDELGMAQQVAQITRNGETVVCFETPAGYWESIGNAAEEDGHAGLIVQVYAPGATGPGEPLGEPRELVPDASFAAARGYEGKMHLLMGPVVYADGVFTVNDLKVQVEGDTLLELPKYEVRAALAPDNAANAAVGS